MKWWIVVVIVLAIVVVIQAVTKRPRAAQPAPEEAPAAEEKTVRYQKKRFLSASEKSFMDILRALEAYHVIVVPQVNLATVIEKVGEFRYQNELYRNVEFGIFDADYNPLLLIELNDASHQQDARKARDAKVKSITSQAGIQLMTFYTNKPNKPDYVIERILTALKLQKEPATESSAAPPKEPNA